MRANEQTNRIKGALYGVAVGDALGGPVEFMSAEQIAQRHGRLTEMVGGGWLSLSPGEITDDTQMTLCVAEGITEAPEEPIQAIGRRFIAWADHGPKDIGGACSSSIWNAERAGGKTPTAEQWMEAAEKTQRNQGHPVEGNGALMRTVYPGLFYQSEEKAQDVAERVARMTHAGRQSTQACKLYTRMVHLLTASETQQSTKTPRQFMIEYCQDIAEYEAQLRSTTPTVKPAMGGYVVDSMRIALGCIATTGTFTAAVTAAVNLGGDADTNGAITGGLAGAWYGYNAIPETWINALAPEVKKELNRLAKAAAVSRRE